MYLCSRDIALPLSTNFLLDFETVPTVWYFCFSLYYWKTIRLQCKNKGPLEKRDEQKTIQLRLMGCTKFIRLQKCQTYLPFLHLSKAFDRIWRVVLFYLLQKVEYKASVGLRFKARVCPIPTSFSVLMIDLIDMLQHMYGYGMTSEVNNYLLYTDNIFCKKSSNVLFKQIKMIGDR